MANIDKLRNEVAATKEDMLSSMEPEAIGPYIWNLLTDYYYSYVNDDMDKFHTVDEALVEAIEVAYDKTNNAANFINYCRISIMTVLLNKLFKRDESLEIPDTVVIHKDYSNKTKEEMEKEYEDIFKSYFTSDLNEMMEEDNEYFKNLEVEMMNDGDYVKHLIRPDVDQDFIKDHLEILEDILTDEGMTVINHYMKEDGRA